MSINQPNDYVFEMENEDGEKIEVTCVSRIEVDETEYLLLKVIDEEDTDEDCECFIFKCTSDENQEMILDMLEEGEEFDKVANMFITILGEDNCYISDDDDE